MLERRVNFNPFASCCIDVDFMLDMASALISETQNSVYENTVKGISCVFGLCLTLREHTLALLQMVIFLMNRHNKTYFLVSFLLYAPYFQFFSFQNVLSSCALNYSNYCFAYDTAAYIRISLF